VSTGFANPVELASELPRAKIGTLTHSLAFTYRFWRVHALPLVWTRLSCPRWSRGSDAERPRHRPARWPVRGQSAPLSSPQPVRVRGQSATALEPPIFRATVASRPRQGRLISRHLPRMSALEPNNGLCAADRCPSESTAAAASQARRVRGQLCGGCRKVQGCYGSAPYACASSVPP
jgi:hypothetical protein